MIESEFQKHLIKTLESSYPGSLILKNDSGYLQGIPDLVIFYRDRWGFLEVKATATSPYQPNQKHYLEMLNEMSFASVIYPSIEREVLSALQEALRPRGNSRHVQRE